MLHEADLEAAVAGGIVTTDQAVALRALAEKRAREHALAVDHEERFQFMRSFNDFFFAIGVALLGGGLVFFTAPIPLNSLVAAAIVWALAELLVARMRLVLPGILLACFFVTFILLATPVDFWFTASSPGFDALQDWFTRTRRAMPVQRGDIWPMMMIAYTLVGAAAALLFYARFRLPFALLLVAGGLACAAFGATHHYWPAAAKQIEPFVLLVCGFVVFAAAMAFDASDRERLTRRADCAFWLHLLAAPLIVHSLIELAWLRSPGGIRSAASLTTESAIAIAAIVAVLAVVAIIIDRRALLVSALTYLGVVIGYAIANTIGQQGADKSFVFFATLVVLGALVVALGVGWQPLRRLFVSLLSPGIASRLPPVALAR
jgi:hypothetical protein